jgi:hypothetical protein
MTTARVGGEAKSPPQFSSAATGLGDVRQRPTVAGPSTDDGEESPPNNRFEGDAVSRTSAAGDSAGVAGFGAGVVGKGTLPFAKKKSPPLETIPAKGTGSIGGGRVGGGGTFTTEGGFPMPLKGKESASAMDTERGITGGGGTFLSGPKKTIGVVSDGAVGKGMFPFAMKSPSLVTSTTRGIGSFGGVGGVSGGAFMAKNGIIGSGFPTPLKGKESASAMDTERGITGGGGTFPSGPKKTIGVARGGTDKKASFSPPKGVLGKGFPLSLKSLLPSLKRDDDISERPGDVSVSSPTVNESIDPLMTPPSSSPDNPLKGAEVFASGVGMKTPNMTGPPKTNSFLGSLSKGKRFGEIKAKDNGNIATPTKGSFFESLSKGNSGATINAKSDGVSSTSTNKSFWGSFSKGTLGEMKANGMPTSANVGTGLPFVKKSIVSTKDGAGATIARTPAAGAIGTSSKMLNMVGESGPCVGGGGLPFAKKSSFDENPTMGIESLGVARPRAPEGLSSMEEESSRKSSAAGDAMGGKGGSETNSGSGAVVTNSNEAFESKTPPLKGLEPEGGLSFDRGSVNILADRFQVGSIRLQSTTTTAMTERVQPRPATDVLLPANYLPLTEGLTAEEAEGVRMARLDDADAFAKSLEGTASSPTVTISTATTETVVKAGTRTVVSPAIVMMQPAPPPISSTILARDDDGTRAKEMNFTGNEMKRDYGGDVALSLSPLLSQTISALVGPDEEDPGRQTEEARIMTDQLEQERLSNVMEQERILTDQKQIVKAARLEQERLADEADSLRQEVERLKQERILAEQRKIVESARREQERLEAEADSLRQEVDRLKQDNLAEAARLEAERSEHARLAALIEQEKISNGERQKENDAAWLDDERELLQESEWLKKGTIMDLIENESSGYYGGGVTVSSSRTMPVVVGPEEVGGISLLTTMSLADAKEEPSWRIASSILGDDVMAEEGLTFPLLHIGNRIQSSSYGTTHECFLFQLIEDDDGDSNTDNVVKFFDDGNVRFCITPCIAKRPWSMPELNATVPSKVLAFERKQRYYDEIEDDVWQSIPEPWELDDKAVKIRRYYEVEIHIFQKFERKREFIFEQRRRIRQQEEAERERGSAKNRGDTSIRGMTDNLIAVPKFLKVYPDDGSGGPNFDDAIPEYGATGADVWGKTLSGLGGSHEWLVYEGRFESEVTLLDAMEVSVK